MTPVNPGGYSHELKTIKNDLEDQILIHKVDTSVPIRIWADQVRFYSLKYEFKGKSTPNITPVIPWWV